MALPKITSNSPAAGSISWTAFSIAFGGVSYGVAAGNTAAKYVWWEYRNGAPALIASNTFPALYPEDILLFLNKGGVGVLAPMATVIDGSLIVPESILAYAIGADQINADHLQAGSVVAEAIAAGAITTDKLAVGSVSDNLVLNGSFEEFDAQGFPLGWVATALSGGGSIAVVTGVSSSGSRALRLQATSTTSNLRMRQAPERYIPVSSTAGRKWYVSARVGAGTATTKGGYLRVNWHDANKTLLSSVDIAANKPLTTTFDIWEGQATPPSTARYMSIEPFLYQPNVATNMYVDEVTAREVIVSAVISDGAITAPKIVASEEMWAKVLGAHKITALEIDVDNLAANSAFINDLEVNLLTGDVFQGKQFTGGTFTGALFETKAAANAGIKIDSNLNALLAYDTLGNNTVYLDGDTGSFAAVGEYATVNTNPYGDTARGILGTSTMTDSMTGAPYQVPSLIFEYDHPDNLAHPIIRSDYRTNIALISGTNSSRPEDQARLDFDYNTLTGWVQAEETGKGYSNTNLYMNADPDQATGAGPRWAAAGLKAEALEWDPATGMANPDRWVKGGMSVSLDKMLISDHVETNAKFGIFDKAEYRAYGDGQMEIAAADAIFMSAPGGIYNGWDKTAGRLDYTGRELGANVNLNNITKPGLYNQRANANTSSALNYPQNSAGVLEVFSSDEGRGDFIYQRYTVYKDHTNWTWTRSYYNGWGAWNRLSQASVYSGSTNLPNVAANGGQVQATISFPAGMFKTPPSVVGVPSNGRCTFVSFNITTTSATIRCWNFTSGEAYTNVANWVAISDGL